MRTNGVSVVEQREQGCESCVDYFKTAMCTQPITVVHSADPQCSSFTRLTFVVDQSRLTHNEIASFVRYSQVRAPIPRCRALVTTTILLTEDAPHTRPGAAPPYH